MICSVSSLIYVSLKVGFVFDEPMNGDDGGNYFRVAEMALFLFSSPPISLSTYTVSTNGLSM
ncbi:hypothetical protein Bca101_056688 [Brassica carinata]